MVKLGNVLLTCNAMPWAAWDAENALFPRIAAGASFALTLAVAMQRSHTSSRILIFLAATKTVTIMKGALRARRENPANRWPQRTWQSHMIKIKSPRF